MAAVDKPKAVSSKLRDERTPIRPGVFSTAAVDSNAETRHEAIWSWWRRFSVTGLATSLMGSCEDPAAARRRSAGTRPGARDLRLTRTPPPRSGRQ